MSNRLYDILNTFNKLVAKDEPKKTITESAVSAKPKTKLEETMAKVEADLKTFKEAKKAKPDFLDMDKDGDKKEPFKKAIKDKKVNEMDYGGGRSPHGGHNLPRDAEDQPGPQVTVNPQKAKDAKKDIEDQLTKAFQNQPVKQNVGGKKVSEAAKPDFLDMDKDGNKKEPMKKAIKDKKVTEAATNKDLAGQIAQLLAKGNKVDSRVIGAMGHITRAEGTHITLAKLNKPTSKMRYSWMLTPQRAEKLEIVKAGPNHYVVRDTDEAWGEPQKSLGLEMPTEGKTVTEAPKKLISGAKLGIPSMLTPFYFNAIAKYLKANGLKSVAQFSSEDIDALSSKLGVSMDALADLVDFNDEVAEAAENPAQQRILDANKTDLAEFLKTGYLDTTSDLYYQMYEYYANQMDPKVRRNEDAQYDFITSKIREIADGVTEAAAPGQEAWIKKMKPKFVKQYGKKKGMEVLYATAWKRSKNEGAYDAEISEEDPVFEREDDDASYWEFKDLKDKPTSGTRKVAGTRYGGSAQKDDDEDEDDIGTTKADAPKRGRGRPKGSGKKLGSRGPTGRSKLMKESRPSLMDRLLDETYAMFGEDNTDLTLDQDQLRQHIGDSNFEQLRQAMATQGSFPESMYDALYDYFTETGEMPYGAATAEDDDPYNWIHQKLDQMFGDDNNGEDYGTFGDDERPEEDEMNAESVNESKDMIAESLSRILHTYPHEVKTFLAGGDLDNDLYSALVDYYDNQGEMPYRVKTGSGTIDWVADKFGTDLRNVELDEAGPNLSDVPAYMRKQQGQNFPLTRDQITPAEEFLWVVPGPGSRDFEARAFPNTPQGKMAADEFAYGVKGNVVLSAEQPVAEEAAGGLESELKELARLAGLKESCGEVSPLTQTNAQEPTAGMSINTNVDTRTGTKTMTVTADGEVADKLAEILSLSGLATQVTARSSEVVGQDSEQAPEMQVVAVGETKDERYHANTTPEPEQADVEAIIDQGDDLNRKKKQHADKPKLGDNPMATESISLSRSLVRELESIKVKK